VELQEKKASFEKNGLHVASVSYDSVEILKSFGDRVGITFPMLADPDSRIIRDFGILNESIQKGTQTYGIPYPGSYIIDARGVVKSKFFTSDYKERYTGGNILLKSPTQTALTAWKEVKTPHLRLRYRASDDVVRAGNHVVFELEVFLKPKMHVYAPGVQGSYIPVQWQMAAGPWHALDAEWPSSKKVHLKVIHEILPVYKGEFVVSRDIVFAQQKELMAAAGEGKQLVLEGTFRYQACDDKECYVPANIPLKWTLRVAEMETQRVPEALRRRK
jgi:hypothetical protein